MIWKALAESLYSFLRFWDFPEVQSESFFLTDVKTESVICSVLTSVKKNSDWTFRKSQNL